MGKHVAPGKTRLVPGPLIGTLVIAAATGAVLPHILERPGDPAVRNVISMVLGAVTVLSLWSWFVFGSGYPRLIRRLVGGSALPVLIVIAVTVRIDGFTGNLIPRFRWAWQRPPDSHLLAPKTMAQKIDLQTTTPDDFPQFLGPYRNGTLPERQLVDPRKPLELLWKQPIGAGWCAFSAVNGYAVTMEQRGPEELVTCYHVLTGKAVWAHGVTVRHETLMGGVGPRATPSIVEGRVYAMGATGILRCLDATTGRLLWQRDVANEFGVPGDLDMKYVAWGRANSPLVFDGQVVVPAGGPTGKATSLVAYRAVDGERLWTAGEDQISYSSPILATLNGQRQIIVVNESSVTGHEPQTGHLLWRFSWPGNSTRDANTSQPHVYRDTVLVSKGYGGGLARFRIRGDSAEPLYHNRQVLKTKLTSFVIRDRFAFGLSDGILECVDLEDGQRQWKAGRYGHGQVLLVDKHLLVLSEQGELAIVEASPEAYRELARQRVLEGQTWNNLCLYGQYLLLRNAQEAACYRLACQTVNSSAQAANLQE